jgi:hypothetical protein
VCGTFKERTGWHPCQMPEGLLKRIIAASSNPGDCILDPFSGSGTTVVVAYQMNRDYVGIEISEQYAKKAKERMVKLQKQKQKSVFFDHTEMSELKRLFHDMQIPAKEITEDRNLVQLFTNQFTVRMNNSRRYGLEEIVTALKDLAD